MILKKENSNGRTMVEIIAVISIVGLLSIIGFSSFGFVSTNIKYNNIDDVVLKSITQINGGQIREIEFLERFMEKALPGHSVDVSETALGSIATYSVSINNVGSKVIKMFRNESRREYRYSNASSSDSEILKLEFDIPIRRRLN